MTDVKRMGVHEALDEVRAQYERLEEEVRTKMDLCNSLKRSQNELITKFQEAKAQSEKQAQELSTKSEELSTLSQLHNDLKSSFQEKETSVKHLSSVIEKVRLEYGEKVQKLEGENKELLLALDEATTNSRSLKSKVDSYNSEIEDLKRIILLKDKKLVEVSDKPRESKDVTQREEVISTLKEKYRDVQDRLKWKTEQFQHLEEAHGRLQYNFKSSKAEWEKEKSLLLEEISSLQTVSEIDVTEHIEDIDKQEGVTRPPETNNIDPIVTWFKKSLSSLQLRENATLSGDDDVHEALMVEDSDDSSDDDVRETGVLEDDSDSDDEAQFLLGIGPSFQEHTKDAAGNSSDVAVSKRKSHVEASTAPKRHKAWF